MNAHLQPGKLHLHVRAFFEPRVKSCTGKTAAHNQLEHEVASVTVLRAFEKEIGGAV